MVQAKIRARAVEIMKLKDYYLAAKTLETPLKDLSKTPVELSYSFLSLYATSMRHIGKLDTCIRVAQKMISVHPDYAEGYLLLATCQEDSGKLQDVLSSLKSLESDVYRHDTLEIQRWRTRIERQLGTPLHRHRRPPSPPKASGGHASSGIPKLNRQNAIPPRGESRHRNEQQRPILPPANPGPSVPHQEHQVYPNRVLQNTISFSKSYRNKWLSENGGAKGETQQASVVKPQIAPKDESQASPNDEAQSQQLESGDSSAIGEDYLSTNEDYWKKFPTSRRQTLQQPDKSESSEGPNQQHLQDYESIHQRLQNQVNLADDDLRLLDRSNPVSQREFFNKFLGDNGIVAVDKGAGDGDCLFEALVHQSYARNGQWRQVPTGERDKARFINSKALGLRELIADEIKNHADLYILGIKEMEGIWDESIPNDQIVDTYVQKLRQPKFYGDAVCILAFSTFYQVPVDVYVKENEKLDKFDFVMQEKRSNVPSAIGASRIRLGWKRGIQGDGGNHFVSAYTTEEFQALFPGGMSQA